MISTLLRWGLAGCLLLGLALPLLANDLYTGEVPVANQDDEARREATAAALRQVLVKVSGDAGAATRPEVQSAIANPEPLVQAYQYRQEVERVGGVPTLKLYFSASFEPRSVQRLLSGAGLSQWARERPALMAWIAVDAGASTQLLSAGQMAGLLRRAAERGLTLRAGETPAGEQSARLAAVESRALDSLRQVASSYGAPGVLTGRIYQTADGAIGRFAYSDGEREESFEMRAGEQFQLLQAAADELANRMAARYAFAAADSTPVAVNIEVRGVRGAEDFARVQAYLGSLSIVRRINLGLASGDMLAASLSVAGGGERLRQIAGLSELLVAAGDAADGTLVFELR